MQNLLLGRRRRLPAVGLPVGTDAAIAAVASATLACWALVMMAGPAETSSQRDLPPRAAVAADGPETLVGGYVGAPYTHPSDVRITKQGVTDLTVQGVNWDARPFKSPIYYGIRSWRWSAGATGGMIDFLHSKTIARKDQQARMSGTRNGAPVPASARIGDTFKHLEFSHGHNLLMLNGLLRLGRMTPWLRPYLGAGGGVALPHTEVGFLDETVRTYEYQYAGPAGQLMAGFEIRLPRVTVFIEYKFTLAFYDVPLSGRDSRGLATTDYYNQLTSWLSGGEPKEGRLRTTLASHQIVGGAALRFAAAPAAQ
jgi:hypothetical protein